MCPIPSRPSHSGSANGGRLNLTDPGRDDCKGNLGSREKELGDSERDSVFTGHDQFCLLSDGLAQLSSSQGWNSLIPGPSQI